MIFTPPILATKKEAQTAHDIVRIFMQGMEEKSNGWIFCNDYAGATALSKDGYQKQLTVKQTKWLTEVAARNDHFPVSSRGGMYLNGWMHSLMWDLFIRKNGSSVLTIKKY